MKSCIAFQHSIATIARENTLSYFNVRIGRSDSAETRQRKRTRECLMEKMGGAGGGRVRSASAGRDKRTEMACRYCIAIVLYCSALHCTDFV